MPGLSHEAFVALFRNRPELAPELLRGPLHVDVPEYAEIRIEDSDLSQLRPAVFSADLVLLLRNGDPVFAIVVEVQLSEDADKLFSWPVYTTTVRARYRCPVVLLVVTPLESVAAWAARPISVGGESSIVPQVLGPRLIPSVTEPEAARRDPELAVLSALAHGNEGDLGLQVVRAALVAAADLEAERAGLYHDVILATLGEATRNALEQIMSGYQFQTDFAKKHQAIGRAEGEAKGEARSLLRVLEARQLPVTDADRARILATTDLDLLDRWLVRAVTASQTSTIFED